MDVSLTGGQHVEKDRNPGFRALVLNRVDAIAEWHDRERLGSRQDLSKRTLEGTAEHRLVILNEKLQAARPAFVRAEEQRVVNVRRHERRLERRRQAHVSEAYEDLTEELGVEIARV